MSGSMRCQSVHNCTEQYSRSFLSRLLNLRPLDNSEASRGILYSRVYVMQLTNWQHSKPSPVSQLLTTACSTRGSRPATIAAISEKLRATLLAYSHVVTASSTCQIVTMAHRAVCSVCCKSGTRNESSSEGQSLQPPHASQRIELTFELPRNSCAVSFIRGLRRTARMQATMP